MAKPIYGESSRFQVREGDCGRLDYTINDVVRVPKGPDQPLFALNRTWRYARGRSCLLVQVWASAGQTDSPGDQLGQVLWPVVFDRYVITERLSPVCVVSVKREGLGAIKP